MSSNGANKTNEQPKISQSDLDSHATFDETTAENDIAEGKNLPDGVTTDEGMDEVEASGTGTILKNLI